MDVIYLKANNTFEFEKAKKYLLDKKYSWVGLNKNPCFTDFKGMYHGNSKLLIKGFFNNINNKKEIQVTTISIEKSYPQIRNVNITII